MRKKTIGKAIKLYQWPDSRHEQPHRYSVFTIARFRPYSHWAGRLFAFSLLPINTILNTTRKPPLH